MPAFDIIYITYNQVLAGTIPECLDPDHPTQDSHRMNPPPCWTLGQRLNPCAKALHAQEVEGRVDLPIEHWYGWRIRAQFLLGPGGIRFRASCLSFVWAHQRGIIPAITP